MIEHAQPTASAVTAGMISSTVRELGLQEQAVCIHASLRSFGAVTGGASAIVDAFLAEGCTVMVPTFSTAAYEVWPTPHDLIRQNAWGADAPSGPTPGIDRVYCIDATEIDPDMGAMAATVLPSVGHVRGAHPLNSFTAVGPRAHDLIDRQTLTDVFAPLHALIEAHGFVLLMGVGLDRLTLLHAAEERAGRRPFIRWAMNPNGCIVRVRAGGCSEGFDRLAPVLAKLTVAKTVGGSRWLVLPAGPALTAAANAIQRDPGITHCEDPTCARCNDALLGGPVLED